MKRALPVVCSACGMFRSWWGTESYVGVCEHPKRPPAEQIPSNELARAEGTPPPSWCPKR